MLTVTDAIMVLAEISVFKINKSRLHAVGKQQSKAVSGVSTAHYYSSY